MKLSAIELQQDRNGILLFYLIKFVNKYIYLDRKIISPRIHYEIILLFSIKFLSN
jgi:hypothetical protein